LDIKFKVENYVSLVRALQTFQQFLKFEKNGTISLQNFPIIIKDYPEYEYRGVMIDTARHFVPIKILNETIEVKLFHYNLKINAFFLKKNRHFP
jgi:hexosaminidase